METYESFAALLDRTSYQKPALAMQTGDFVPSKGVLRKVNADNQFKPFYGDTTVFDVENDVKAKVAAIQDTLYAQCPECFCARLAPETTHMTLHDLNAAEQLSEVAADTFDNEVKLLQICREQRIPPQKIRMTTHYITDSVSTSLVLSLLPADETEWRKLQQVFQVIETFNILPHQLYPHITLAYYNYNGFSKATADRLRQVVFDLNQTGFDVILDTRRLYYQKFTDMNTYYNVFPLAK